ncbi:hypothetical protein BH18ACT1_BH18ACT1_05370 [soil metagenome]
MTTTAKRQRQREGRVARLEAERRAAQGAARKRRIIAGVVVGALLIGVLGLISIVGGDDGDDQASDSTTTTTALPTPEKPDVTIPETPPPTELVSTNLERGEGPKVQEGDTVSVRYVGKSYSTDTEFDSNYDAPEPFQFTIGAGNVIPGWDQGVPGMRPGGRRQLVIPPELGYGAEGQPPDIGPNETLVFVIDLLSVEPAAAEPAPEGG